MIIERRVDEGVAVEAGEPILHIIDTQAMEARIGILESLTASLQPGTDYDIVVEGFRHRATLRAILAVLDNDTRTVPLTATSPSAFRNVRPAEVAVQP